MKKEAQEVDVYVSMSGSYVANHEMSINVCYDITNDKRVGFSTNMTLEELKKWSYEGDYSDYARKSALLVDGKYYIKF